MAERLGSVFIEKRAERLRVRLPPEPFPSRPRGAVRSARHPVTVEIMGSNPIEDAYRQVDAVRNLAKRRSSNQQGPAAD